MNILIVDDERLARSDLQRMLVQLGLKGSFREAASVKEALAAIKESRPDLLLLDIQIPGGSGFDLLKALRAECPPVIFTTAYEQFAAQAFEFEALDYLLKPFDQARLAKALSRLGASDNAADKLAESDSILLKIDGECLLLTVKSIERIEVTDQGTIVHWGKNSGRINKTIARLEQQLDPKLFFRASRDCLLNVRTIRSISNNESGQLVAQLSHNGTATFSRRQGAFFQKTHKI
jgi:two-component system LytT family response regulator